MPPPYTPSQKNAIAQFVSFTHAKDSVAARHLKSHAWNVEQAVDAVMGGKSREGPWDTPQASHGNDETPEADPDWEYQEDDTRERKLYKGRARLDRKLGQSHLSSGRETMLDDDEEGNSKMLLNLYDTGSFEYDLGDYVHDDPEPSLDPLHPREINMCEIEDLFLQLCVKAKEPTSWVDPRKLPSMLRFALRRPLMPERELYCYLELAGIDPSLGFLDPNNYSSEGSCRRPRQILKGIVFDEEEKGHVSSRYKALPKGLSFLADRLEDIEETGSAEDEPTDQDEMIAALWAVFNGVGAQKIRLEDAPKRYRHILSDLDCSDEGLAAWLEDFAIPSDHIHHGSHHAALSKSPGNPNLVRLPMLLEEIAGLVRLYRSEEMQSKDFLTLLRERLAGSTFNRDMTMGYVMDSTLDARVVADLLLGELLGNVLGKIKSTSSTSSGNGSETAAQKGSCRSPVDTPNPGKSTLGDSMNQDLKEEFAAIRIDVVCSHISFGNALSRSRELLGDLDMSDTVLSKNLAAYSIPPDLFFGGEDIDEMSRKPDVNLGDAQITQFKKPRITLRLHAKPSSPTSPRDLIPKSVGSRKISTQSDTADHVVTQGAMSDQCGTVAMVKALTHDGYDAALRNQAATTLGGILQSSPGNPNVAASSRVIPSAEQQSPTTQAKQQQEQHQTEGSCQTVSMTLSTQNNHSIGHEKPVNRQDLVSASMPTGPADSHPESEFTKSALSVEKPAFAQPLPRHNRTSLDRTIRRKQSR